MAAPPSPAPCFRIRRVVLDGNVPALDFLQADVDRYAGACVGVAQINAITQDLQHDLLTRGFVTTRVRVPEQNLAGGDLRLELTPGTIRQIRFAQPTP